MRLAFLLALLLVAAGLLAIQVDFRSTAQASEAKSVVKPGASPAWVRTPTGWEQPTAWRVQEKFAPSLHPSVVAVFVALAGVGLLLGFPSTRRSAARAKWRQKRLF